MLHQNGATSLLKQVIWCSHWVIVVPQWLIKYPGAQLGIICYILPYVCVMGTVAYFACCVQLHVCAMNTAVLYCILVLCTATCLVLQYSTIYIFCAMGTTAMHYMPQTAACFEVLLHIYDTRTAALYCALLHIVCHGQHYSLGVLPHVVPLTLLLHILYAVCSYTVFCHSYYTVTVCCML